ncbi:hypothetical protein PISMIDRAFT_689957 [Pisolithus microcarpus 441]|uniref:Uncharacterized protein n=1 Tax=Pisolithus microcarpus 441 TaxID=765257 RepID=A0A0C9YNK7_9AGAM|nr:hypothetical protein PISMIDRAFT_689957 [Pisolithus microcarpus 441]
MHSGLQHCDDNSQMICVPVFFFAGKLTYTTLAHADGIDDELQEPSNWCGGKQLCDEDILL